MIEDPCGVASMADDGGVGPTVGLVHGSCSTGAAIGDRRVGWPVTLCQADLQAQRHPPGVPCVLTYTE
jgi:hypothetical protein